MRSPFHFATLAVYLLGAAPLLAQGYVTGRVYQRQGNGTVPVAQAHDMARSAETGSRLAEVISDDYGSYVLRGLPPGDVTVEVSHPRYHAASQEHYESGAPLRCPDAGSCGTHDFEMTPNGNLAVRVTDAIGQPVDEVAVRVTSLDEPDSVAKPAAFKDARGVLYVSLPPGRYRVHAEPSKRLRGIQFEPADAEIEFGHGQLEKAIEMILPSGRRYRVSGRVTGLEPSNAERMMITFVPPSVEEQADLRRFGAPLNRSGHFALSGLPPGRYIIELTRLPAISPTTHALRVHYLQTVDVNDDLRGLLFSISASDLPD